MSANAAFAAPAYSGHPDDPTYNTYASLPSNNTDQQQADALVPGSGSYAPGVTPGDNYDAQPATSGTADQGPGHNFPVGNGSDRTMVRVFHTNSRGEREATTIRPDQLLDDELNRIEGILGINMRSGEALIETTATPQQIEQLNEVLAPYPQYDLNGDKKKINRDAPGQNYPKTTSLYGLTSDHPLPTVWSFSRYLVIAGVVLATIFMSLACYSMVVGSPYAGNRVIACAAGLMMLLSAYTIYKIVQMNTFKANSNDPPQIRHGATDAKVQDAFMYRPDTPTIPGGNTTTGNRQGLPVAPLANAKNDGGNAQNVNNNGQFNVNDPIFNNGFPTGNDPNGTFNVNDPIFTQNNPTTVN
ncbi:MAG: hypothetical protein SFY67_04635 [Candidatus Melainabacteria bacterium]|nr:hypothetical protein [Candidatus Melainabacteria bacterium]